MWTDDYDNNGILDPVMAIYYDGKQYPKALPIDFFEHLPVLSFSFPTYKSIADRTIQDILSEELRSKAHHCQAFQLASVVGWNQGEGKFLLKELPVEAQLSPMYGLFAGDLNGDGFNEVLMGGNLYNVKPEVGRYDASFGVCMSVGPEGLTVNPPSQSGFRVQGEIRHISKIETGNRSLLIVSRNNEVPKIFEIIR